MPDVFDIVRIIKKFIPPHKQVELQDRIINTLANAFPDERWHRVILAFRSDAAFQDSLAAALRRAVQRFVVDYPDKELVNAVTQDTHFWDSLSVKHALQELVTRPSVYLNQEWEIVLTSFADILPTQDPERVESAVRFFLRYLTQEVINIPQLTPIYQVQLQWASLEQSFQLVSLQKDQNQLITTLLEAMVQNQRLLVIPADPLLPKVFENLPPRYGEFLGREKDIKRVLDAMRSRWPLISIEGLGGIGKTSLAIQSIYYCLPGPLTLLDPPFEYAVWVSAKDRPEQKQWLNEVLDITARLLGYPSIAKLTFEQMEQKKGEIYQLLHNYRTLLVIDNFETIKDLALEAWIQDIPEPSKVLITSRTGQLRSSRAITLKGLEDPESLELIRSHAQSLSLQAIAVASEEVLLPLVRVTGGNPKAIVFALGYIKRGRLSLGELIEHLHVANRTVNGLFDELFAQIWGVMSKEAKDALLVIPFFAEFASKEALGAAAGLTDYYLDNAVEELVELKLLDIKEETVAELQHYSAHPLTRAFASAQLRETPSFEEQARERWKKYYLEFTTSYLKREQPKERYWNALVSNRIAPIDNEWPNLHKLLTWADSKPEGETLVEQMLLLTHYLNLCLLLTERLYFARRAAESAEQLGRMDVAAVFRIDALGSTLIEQGLLVEAENEIKKGKQIALRNHNRNNNVMDIIVLAQTFLARVRLEQGKVSEASSLIETLIHKPCRPVVRSRINLVAGDIAYKLKNKSEALKFYEKAIQLNSLYRDKEDALELYNRLGDAYLIDINDESSLIEAEKVFVSTLNASYDLNTAEAIYAKYGLARVARAKGDKVTARRLAQEALDSFDITITSHPMLSELRDFVENLESQ